MWIGAALGFFLCINHALTMPVSQFIQLLTKPQALGMFVLDLG
jgi:hypothetical protein